MKKIKSILVGAAISAVALAASAQTNVFLVTNYVTVTITNVVTVTNVVATVPAAAAAPVAEAKPDAKVPPQEPKYPWNSSLTAGLSLTRGNSHTLLYHGAIDTDKKTPENEYMLGAGGSYGSQNSKENVNEYGGYSQWNKMFTPRFYSYVRGEAKRDLIADLDYRFNIGPGAGYYLIKEELTTLSAEAGGGYLYEHLGDDFHSYATVRFAEKFEHKFKDRARVFQSVEFLPQVDEFDNYIINFEVGAEASLTKTFSLKTTLKDTYQAQPAPGRLKNDVQIISGLSYKF